MKNKEKMRYLKILLENIDRRWKKLLLSDIIMKGVIMPTISMFYGILVRMYYDDHNPPHFHAFYSDYKAIFDFEGKILEGYMPTKQVKLISAWSIIHKDELLANWELAKNGETLFNITPLV